MRRQFWKSASSESEEAGKEDEEKREERWISRGCWIAHTCERQRDG